MKSRVARLFAFAVLTGTCLPLAAASAAAPPMKPAK
jgi:hypothetical protein